MSEHPSILCPSAAPNLTGPWVSVSRNQPPPPLDACLCFFTNQSLKSSSAGPAALQGPEEEERRDRLRKLTLADTSEVSGEYLVMLTMVVEEQADMAIASSS